eukprot:3152378-Pleurochrysis_carterae.AAC.2
MHHTLSKVRIRALRQSASSRGAATRSQRIVKHRGRQRRSQLVRSGASLVSSRLRSMTNENSQCPSLNVSKTRSTVFFSPEVRIIQIEKFKLRAWVPRTRIAGGHSRQIGCCPDTTEIASILYSTYNRCMLYQQSLATSRGARSVALSSPTPSSKGRLAVAAARTEGAVPSLLPIGRFRLICFRGIRHDHNATGHIAASSALATCPCSTSLGSSQPCHCSPGFLNG